MTFAYYNRLSAGGKRLYRKSDAIALVNIPGAAELYPLTSGINTALGQENRAKTEKLCGLLADALTRRLSIPPVRVTVLAVRPSKSWGELHGLYVLDETRSPAVITVWMRTAKFRRVVAFRSFLRTLLHELCHHIDYTLFKFPESYHTEGFYRRESSLFHQIVAADDIRSKKSARG